LVLGVALLLLTIEGALNEIFQVIRMRLLRQRLLVFWAVMTISPAFLGIGVTLPGYFASQEMGEGGTVVTSARAAMLRYTFAVYVIFMTLYQAIYGALAAVPVFLV
jgi:membrane protein